MKFRCETEHPTRQCAAAQPPNANPDPTTSNWSMHSPSSGLAWATQHGTKTTHHHTVVLFRFQLYQWGTMGVPRMLPIGYNGYTSHATNWLPHVWWVPRVPDRAGRISHWPSRPPPGLAGPRAQPGSTTRLATLSPSHSPSPSGAPCMAPIHSPETPKLPLGGFSPGQPGSGAPTQRAGGGMTQRKPAKMQAF